MSVSTVADWAAVGGETVRCNLCGADDAKELYRRSDYRFEVDGVEWPLVQCRQCSLAYLNPRPAPSAIWRYYPKRFYEHRDAAALAERYRKQSAYLADVPPGALLDIGCANGDWIRLMQDQGWRVAGLEPSGDSANPHHLDISHSTLENATFADNSFDAITAWAVFEHLHDPMRGFQHAQRWLKPGGRLIIVVTNIRSLASRFAYQEDIPRHLVVFSERTLRRYADTCGLELVKVEHDTKLFGGSGRGVLRVRLFQLFGLAPLQYFRAMRLPLGERFRAYPLLALAIAPFALLERVLLPDWLICGLRLNGTIVAIMRKPTADQP
jgi:SAM-dependent methyltransferase